MLDKNAQFKKLYNEGNIIEDADLTHFYYIKKLTYEFLIAIFTVICLALGLFIFHSPSTPYASKAKISILIFSLLSMISTCMETFTKNQWLAEKALSRKQKKSYTQLLAKLISFCVFPNNYFLTSYNDYLTVCMGLRMFYLIKFVVHGSIYYGSRPDRVSAIYSVELSTFHSFKLLIKNSPQVLFLLIFFLNIILLPTLLLLVQSKENPMLGSFALCLQFCLVTEATVGYGNLNVTTIPGKAISILCAMTGVMSISVLIIYFQEFMKIPSTQEMPHFIINNLVRKKSLLSQKINLLQNRYIHNNRNINKISDEKLSNQENQREEFKFKENKHNYYLRKNPTNIITLMIQNFADQLERLNFIQTNTNLLLEFSKKTLEESISKQQQKKQKSLYSINLHQEQNQQNSNEKTSKDQLPENDALTLPYDVEIVNLISGHSKDFVEDSLNCCSKQINLINQCSEIKLDSTFQAILPQTAKENNQGGDPSCVEKKENKFEEEDHDIECYEMN